jgi:hypothetical protein
VTADGARVAIDVDTRFSLAVIRVLCQAIDQQRFVICRSASPLETPNRNWSVGQSIFHAAFNERLFEPYFRTTVEMHSRWVMRNGTFMVIIDVTMEIPR